MKNLLEYILSNVVKHPEDLNIIENELENGSRKVFSYEVNANPEDLSIIIGKEGKTIKSIHSLLRVLAIKKGVFVDIKVNKNIAPE